MLILMGLSCLSLIMKLRGSIQAQAAALAKPLPYTFGERNYLFSGTQRHTSCIPPMQTTALTWRTNHFAALTTQSVNKRNQLLAATPLTAMRTSQCKE